MPISILRQAAADGTAFAGNPSKKQTEFSLKLKG